MNNIMSIKEAIIYYSQNYYIEDDAEETESEKQERWTKQSDEEVREMNKNESLY